MSDRPIPMPLYFRNGDTLRRLAVRCCTVCGTEVTQHGISRGTVGINRIGGDSANGYEPYHIRCVQPERLTPTAADNDDHEWED